MRPRPHAPDFALRDSNLVDGFRRLRLRRLGIVAALAAGALVALALDLSTGPAHLALDRVLATLARPGIRAGAATAVDHVIVWQLRLPVAGMAALVGAALSVAGVEMQAILGNPLASPFTMGVSSMASLGAATAIVTGFAIPGLPGAAAISLAAFVFAAVSLGVLCLLVDAGAASAEKLTLFGVALVFSGNAAVTLIAFMATQDTLQQLLFWTLGNVARATPDRTLLMALVVAATVPFSLAAADDLTALRLGELRARSLGVDVRRLRLGSLLRVSLLAGTGVALVGVIGFIGLVGPHIARRLVGDDHRLLVPAAALVGAMLLSLASSVGKSAVPGVLIPVSIVTAFVGIPVFVALLLWARGR